MNRKDHHHLNLLCDVNELAAVLAGSENIENFLQRTVEMVARHMNASVCAIYLLDEISNELTMTAAVGLNPEAIAKIRFKIGEGLVGETLDKSKPVKEGLAGRDHKLEHLSEAFGASFDSFLAVPVQRGAEKIGVLVVQHQEPHYFDEFDVMAMRAIASQLAGAVGNARLLIGGTSQALDGQSADQGFEMHGPFKGQVASSGCAFAPATVFDKSHGLLILTDTNTNFEFSLADFHCAVQDTTAQIQQLQIRFAQRLAESASLIFTAHRIDTQALSQSMSPVTYTRDGIRVRLLANINLLNDLAIARGLKAEGIGLFRTEFPFLVRSATPSEAEQFHVYKRLFDEMSGREVTIRVLDIGGEKLLAYSDATAEANPELGLRAMRFLFRHHDIFHQQLRAILRAAAGAENPRIMFPMISSLDDYQEARQAVYNCKE
jgi:signal transduction protein with GAF and PtsI domain